MAEGTIVPLQLTCCHLIIHSFDMKRFDISNFLAVFSMKIKFYVTMIFFYFFFSQIIKSCQTNWCSLCCDSLASSPCSTTLSGINFQRGILEGLEYKKYAMVYMYLLHTMYYILCTYVLIQSADVCGPRQRHGIGGADSAKVTFMVQTWYTWAFPIIDLTNILPFLQMKLFNSVFVEHNLPIPIYLLTHNFFLQIFLLKRNCLDLRRPNQIEAQFYKIKRF